MDLIATGRSAVDRDALAQLTQEIKTFLSAQQQHGTNTLSLNQVRDHINFQGTTEVPVGEIQEALRQLASEENRCGMDRVRTPLLCHPSECVACVRLGSSHTPNGTDRFECWYDGKLSHLTNKHEHGREHAQPLPLHTRQLQCRLEPRKHSKSKTRLQGHRLP
jgi:hypothetical protein